MRWVIGLLAVVAAVIGLGVLVVLVTSTDRTLVLDLDVGDCFDPDLASDDDDIATVDTVACTAPHEAEVVAKGTLNDGGDVTRPADDELFAQVDGLCASALADRPALLDRFGILPVVADAASWGAYDGVYLCVAIPYGGGTTTTSALTLDPPNA